MTRTGACPCGTVRFSISGPVRDVIVCHCDACREATGGPWAATAAHRRDLALADETAISWQSAAVSANGASRGRCRTCRTVVFWDAPGRETVSLAAALLGDDGHDLGVAAHIWVPDAEVGDLRGKGLPVETAGLPESVGVRWRD